MSFTPTAGQAEALKVIRSMPERFPGGGGIAVISGYAGTGKTTLLKVLAQEEPTLFVLTPTGKAAVRVKEAAGCDATTIHRWQYLPIKDETTGEYSFSHRGVEDLRLPPKKTLIIDEASMLTQGVFNDLYMFAVTLGLSIVLIGDGFQLPPVETDPTKKTFSVFAADFKADVRVNLTEVLRQALESPIIRISTQIRTQEDIQGALWELDTVSVAKLDGALEQIGRERGVIICHKNVTRHAMNTKIRKIRGLPEDTIVAGEPLLVMRNNYKVGPTGVFNGEIFAIDHLAKKYGPVAVADRYNKKTMYMDFQETDLRENQVRVVISPQEVFGKSAGMDNDVIYKGSQGVIRYEYDRQGYGKEERPVHLHANLGYTMTAHKGQGSEWPTALVLFEDSVRLSTTDGRRWAYTALTRAKNSVRVCWY